MLKKLIISNYDDINNPIYGGGGAYAVHEIAKRLTKKYDVTVLTGKYTGSRNITVDQVKYERVGSPIFGLKLGQLVYQLVLPFVALSRNFDLWIESFTPPFSTAFLPVFTRRQVIGMVHMLAAKDMERKYKLPFSIIENFGLKLYKNFIVLSDVTKEKIIKHSPTADFLVVPNGVNMPAVRKVLTKRNSNVLYIGRIEVDQKGLDLLIEAFKIIKKREPKLKLKIAGTGSNSELELLKGLIKEHGLDDTVQLVGRVVGKNKEKLFETSVMVVIPSRYETFSLSALESLAYGLPLVCFNISGMSWLRGRFVLKARRFNASDLSKKIITLIEKSRVNPLISQSARDAAKKYDWDVIVQKYLKFIERKI